MTVPHALRSWCGHINPTIIRVLISKYIQNFESVGQYLHELTYKQ